MRHDAPYCRFFETMNRYLVKLILLTTIVFLLPKTNYAVTAYPNKIEIVTTNGKPNYIFLKGDENFKYALSTDGYKLLCESSVWKYAETDQHGNLVASKFEYVAMEDESNELKQFKTNLNKQPIQHNTNIAKRSSASSANVRTNKPLVGTKHALVVLMQYSNLKYQHSKEDFQSLFNDIGYCKNKASGSVRDYYDFASSGQLEYISDIYGPYTSKYPMEYYGRNSKAGGNDENAIELCIEAINNLPKDIDYSKYDNDNDGVVDNIHIIFAGYGEEAGASSNAIWAHEYPYKLVMKSFVGYNFAGYSCSPELRGNNGSTITTIGVICHELGHALGASDYYDTNYEKQGSYDGTGMWDIMAQGSWNDNGNTPPNFNPYVRSMDFGWTEQRTLVKDDTITINYCEKSVYRINTNTNGEYFLMENRQDDGFDKYLPGKGLVVYHVSSNINDLASSNMINVTHPQGLYPVCASGASPKLGKYGDINSSACPFPGKNSIRKFEGISWKGDSTAIALQQIVELNKNIRFVVTGHNETHDDDDKNDTIYVYEESFENKTLEEFNVKNKFGNKDWMIYPCSSVIVYSDMIPAPSDGNKLLMLFSGKEKTISESVFQSPTIQVNKDDECLLSLDLMTKNIDSQLPILKIEVIDGEDIIASTSTKNAYNKWETVYLPFVPNGNNVYLRLTGTLFSGGIFADNMKLRGLKVDKNFMKISGTHGVILKHKIEIGKSYEYVLDNDKEGKIKTVLFNGKDVTNDVREGMYTTPEITGDSEIVVLYDNQPLGDANNDGVVDVCDITATASIILYNKVKEENEIEE